MKKIPTIFERDWNGDRSRVLDKPHADCGWVFAGEGIATRKLDGTCCLVRDGKLYKRREVARGKTLPDGFEAVGTDHETGKTVGWVPVGDGPEDQYHRAAWIDGAPDGTYELVGPHVQGGPEKDFGRDVLISHRSLPLRMEGVPRTFDGLREWFTDRDIEGVVFQHPDGGMAKIKMRDFGMKRLTSTRRAS